MSETPGNASDESLVDDSPAETPSQMGDDVVDQDAEPASVPSGAAADDGDDADQDSGPASKPAGAPADARGTAEHNAVDYESDRQV